MKGGEFVLNEFQIENAITAVLGGRHSYRDDKKFSDEQVEELKKAIVAAIKAYDEQVREQEPPVIVNQ